MRCPQCGAPTRTPETKQMSEDTVKRRRECRDCKWRFTTFEVPAKIYAMTCALQGQQAPAFRDGYANDKDVM